MSNTQKTSFSESLIALTILISITTGWAINIAKLMQLEGFSGEMIVRIFGVIIPPLGFILGFV